MAARKTSAWPLSGAYAALIVYASLYPLHGWVDRGAAPFAWLQAAMPQYFTGFDVAVNLIGYAVFGFLVLWYFGLVQSMIGLDKTRVSVVILGVFVATSLHCLYQTVAISRELVAALAETGDLVAINEQPLAFDTGWWAVLAEH